MNKLIIFFCCLFLSANNKVQKTAPLPITKPMSSKIDTTTVDSFSDDKIYNAKALESIFKKLNENDSQRSQKINMVHIGDSHIQGDLMTNELYFLETFHFPDQILRLAVSN